MNVLLNFDTNYAQHAAVVIASFCCNNIGSHHFHVISEYIEKAAATKLQTLVGQYNSHLHVHILSADVTKNLPIGKLI